MQEDYREAAEAKQHVIDRLKAHREAMAKNLELFTLASIDAIRAIELAVAKEGEALYHLQSMQMGRMPPATTVAAQAPPFAQVPIASAPQPLPGPVPTRESMAPGFPVVRPEGVPEAPPGLIAQWEGPASPDWSAADEIDAQGHRHVRKHGAHKIYDQLGKLISSTPIINGAS